MVTLDGRTHAGRVELARDYAVVHQPGAAIWIPAHAVMYVVMGGEVGE